MQVEPGDIRGHVVVVMAPMGSGKGTIVKHALTKYPELKHTVSCTSRSPRPGEIGGQQYHFVSNEEFDQKIAAEYFLEWAVFAGHKYGTPKSEILPNLAHNDVVIVEIELQGVEKLLKCLPREHVTVAYIEAGGWEMLMGRAPPPGPQRRTAK
jgi:guanylate kinase